MVDARSAPVARARRAEILNAAEREFAARGPAGARMERIAAAAGVNKQLLFHYFGSKEGLFVAALRGLLTRAESTVVSGDAPADTIRRTVTAVQDAARSLPGVLTIIAGAASDASLPAEALEEARRWRSRLLDRLQAAVVEGQRRGLFRDDIDPPAVAAIALAAALGVGALSHDSRPAPEVGAFLSDYCAWR